MIYVVEKGDTLSKIAASSGVPVWKIVYDNQLQDKNQIVPGQALLLLKVKEGQEEEDEKDEQISLAEGKTVGGYAYPFIDAEILEQSFPALKELLVFSYGFTFEGDLILPAQDDLWLVETAWRHGAKPLMVLTPFSGGAFNNQLVKVLVENAEVQERLLEQLLEEVEKRGFAGVNIDFEYVLPENKEQYAQLIQKMRESMNKKGYTVSVAVPPKVSDRQKGLLVEGVDYKLVGESADYVFLMTYEWGYTYGPPMAVAPLDKVRQVAEYALGQIPAEKLILGIPNYGYDWQLPYERGITKARTIGNIEAVNLAVSQGSDIQYAPTAQSPWFTYKTGGMEHVVWFEDVRSIQAKWKLVQDLDLAGAWYWNLMRKFRSNWLML
ncbi:LysM peptidoglycan-binding domain-containing protein [Mediterraneibacter sp.]|uniref:LysM peptidoglycan-binding domain-containing protein n=1 Tax=Mediterraneibacter sp. TaxID=2316022 RepID=UPI0027B8D716|nr:glycosyl hydrolase family 18 protein [Mediterraneibacter sp.]